MHAMEPRQIVLKEETYFGYFDIGARSCFGSPFFEAIHKGITIKSSIHQEN